MHSDQGKLNPRSKWGVFTGYPDGVKGFRVWLLDEEKCVISRNVIFREELMYKDINKTNSSGIPISTNFILTTNSLSFEPAGESYQDITRGGAEDSTEGREQKDQVATSDESTGASTSGQLEDLSNYQLVRDREK